MTVKLVGSALPSLALQHPNHNSKAGLVTVTTFIDESRSPDQSAVMMGQVESRSGSGPVGFMARHRHAVHTAPSRREVGATAGAAMQLPSQEDEAPIAAPHSSVPPSSSHNHLTPGHGRAGLECRQPQCQGKVVAESLQGPDTVTQKSAC